MAAGPTDEDGGTPTTTERATGSATEVLLAFLRLGLTSFGGPVAHLAYSASSQRTIALARRAQLRRPRPAPLDTTVARVGRRLLLAGDAAARALTQQSLQQP